MCVLRKCMKTRIFFFSLKTDKSEKWENVENNFITENIMPCFYGFGNYFVKYMDYCRKYKTSVCHCLSYFSTTSIRHYDQDNLFDPFCYQIKLLKSLFHFSILPFFLQSFCPIFFLLYESLYE